ncbi:hypothetical protein GCM10023258_39970 [Terrabacter aeriphilus]|uniref:RDD domain-containing protein n=1 Tax=Terrabacter aeriphilus TaxID=515662 RepID=A0ABP9JQH9_9MICO
MSIPPPPPPYTTGDAGGDDGVGFYDRPGYLGEVKLASWPRRTLATAIDFLVTIYLPTLVHNQNLALVITAVLVLINSVFLQARTYQSLGKVIMGVSLGRPLYYEGRPNEMARPLYLRCLIRVLWHFFDLILFIGFLRPLWNARRQTFADSITHTVVMVGKLSPPVTARGGAVDLA